MSLRYYKNTVNQEDGCNQEVINWCKTEAQSQQLKPADYWGGLVLDEMKIQVNFIFERKAKKKCHVVKTEWCIIEYLPESIKLKNLDLQEDLKLTVRNGQHQLIGFVSLGENM